MYYAGLIKIYKHIKKLKMTKILNKMIKTNKKKKLLLILIKTMIVYLGLGIV